LDISLDTVKNVVSGSAELEDSFNVMRKMNERYPVKLSDMWRDEDDTVRGVLHWTNEQAVESARVLTRRDKDNKHTPYYEYRDSAASRMGPFKPEWIKELRVVDNNDPYNPDVAYNNGHLLLQTTFFIGPVNFYYEVDGKRYCFEANTGDTNYITPFMPHSFASRDPDQEALIIAVTYGGSVRGAMTELARVGAGELGQLTGDARDQRGALKSVLWRHMAAESTTAEQMEMDLDAEYGISIKRARNLVREGYEPTEMEREAMASILSVKPSDLQVTKLDQNEEVVVHSAEDSQPRPYPFEKPTYSITPGARTRHQPGLKTFKFEVLPVEEGAQMQMGLHQFVFNYGDQPVHLSWGAEDEDKAEVAPGDSLYIAPMIQHRFNHAGGDKNAELYVVRIPGALTDGVLSELATFEGKGRSRVGNETMKWYND